MAMYCTCLAEIVSGRINGWRGVLYSFWISQLTHLCNITVHEKVKWIVCASLQIGCNGNITLAWHCHVEKVLRTVSPHITVRHVILSPVVYLKRRTFRYVTCEWAFMHMISAIDFFSLRKLWLWSVVGVLYDILFVFIMIIEKRWSDQGSCYKAIGFSRPIRGTYLPYYTIWQRGKQLRTGGAVYHLYVLW